MDTRLVKLFYEFGDVFDNPKARPFVQAQRNAAGVKNSLLLVNQLHPHMDRCDWISGEDLDLAKCKRILRPHVPILVCAAASVSVSCGAMQKAVIDSAAIFETDNATIFDIPANIRRLEHGDAHLLDEIENDYDVNDIVAQTKGHLTEPTNVECFGIFENGALAAFADIQRLRGSMFAESFSLSNIFTAQPFRRKGYAAALLCGILQSYPKKQFFYTANPATNTASIRLAQKCGFKMVGETTIYQFT